MYEITFWKENHKGAEYLFEEEEQHMATLDWFKPESVAREIKNARRDGASQAESVDAQYLLNNEYLEYPDLKQEIQDEYLDRAAELAEDPNAGMNPYP